LDEKARQIKLLGLFGFNKRLGVISSFAEPGVSSTIDPSSSMLLGGFDSAEGAWPMR
jgi:hypothetical protein